MPREELLEISETLEKTLTDFGIQAKVIQVVQGPVVTRFELKPAPGVKVSRITSLEQDISMAMRATNPVRILAPIPGKAAVGIEVPNRRRAGVYLKELISHDDFWCHKSPMAFALGKTIEGEPFYGDLSKMPHLLVAGATGTGKSVCINAIICSILYRMKPDQVKFLFVDPKRVELALYQDIPHLLAPVVSDPKRAAGALAWVVEQMEERYETLVEFGQRNIDGYNALVADPSRSRKTEGKKLLHMPHMVIVLDELADLMVVSRTDVEENVQRLAQMARAVGIHLIVATQRPSVNVITGVIKANFPARIAFQVSSKADSRVILDINGAETLLGRGDMLFHPGGAPKPVRIQGCFVSEAEVERLVTHIKAQGEAQYVIDEFEPLRDEKGKPLPRKGGANVLWDEDIDDDIEGQGRRGTNKTMGSVSSAGNFVPHAGGSAWAGDDEIDEALVRAAARLVLENRKASVSLLQRRLKVGFARAGRLMDMLEEIGIVGPFQGSKPRDILVHPDQFLAEMDAYEEANS
jgi:S-DNA-T family DNA segregation ATPase FtsK/SpoIIIE